MEIRQLKYFVRLCEDLNFSKAATNLYMTQQALSQSIKNLESELGVTLFIRNKNGVELTDIAEYMLSETTVFLKKYDLMIGNIQDFAMSMKGCVNMAIPPGALHQIVPMVIKQFHGIYPDVELKISEMADIECEENVLSGRCDLGVSVAPVNDNTFDFFPLISENAFLLVNRKNPLAAKDTIRFEDLENENLLLMDKRFKWHEQILKRCKHISVPYYSSLHPSILAELVNQNLGVTFLIAYEVNKHISNDTIAVPIDPDEGFVYSAGLILKKGRPVRHMVSVLVEYIIDSFNNKKLI